MPRSASFFLSVHREVHLCEPDGRRVLFHSIEAGELIRIFLHPLDEVRALHEHPTRTARGVHHVPMIRLDDDDMLFYRASTLDCAVCGFKLKEPSRKILRSNYEE